MVDLSVQPDDVSFATPLYVADMTPRGEVFEEDGVRWALNARQQIICQATGTNARRADQSWHLRELYEIPRAIRRRFGKP